jgi:hypothetical protein
LRIACLCAARLWGPCEARRFARAPPRVLHGMHDQAAEQTRSFVKKRGDRANGA